MNGDESGIIRKERVIESTANALISYESEKLVSKLVLDASDAKENGVA